jgi:hypothetical protein
MISLTQVAKRLHLSGSLEGLVWSQTDSGDLAADGILDLKGGLDGCLLDCLL